MVNITGIVRRARGRALPAPRPSTHPLLLIRFPLRPSQNFGPVGTPITQVSYGVTGYDFNATQCSVTVPHTQLTCNTVVGAGAGLTYKVIIDGQLNTVPTADYAPPAISGVAGMTDASTDGGDVVVISGSQFSTQKWLEAVTYGITGTEFAAAGCTVTVAHSQITCTTVPGTGRALKWFVTVRGQISAPGPSLTSYAPPNVTSVAPLTGPTSGAVAVTLSGVNFGSLPEMKVFMMANPSAAATATAPSAAALADYIASLRAGTAFFSATSIDPVAVWINSLQSPSAILPVIVPRMRASVQFMLPEGFGTARAVIFMVDGVPALPFGFDYSPPVISNLAPDRLGVASGFLRLTIEGSSFCNYQNGCGQLLIDGVPVTSTLVPATTTDANYVAAGNWTHARLLAIVLDPAMKGAGSSSSVQVVVGNQTSNVVSFSAPVPAFDALVGQANWGGGAITQVSVATLTFSLTMRTNKSSTLSAASLLTLKGGGALRVGVAKAAGLAFSSSVVISQVTDLASGVVTTLSPSDNVNAFAAGRRRLQTGSGGGATVSVTFDLVDAAQTGKLVLSPENIAALTANISATITTAAFASAVTANVAVALGVSPLLITPSVSASSIAAPAPMTVTVSGGSAQPTRGGQRFFVNGVMSLFQYFTGTYMTSPVPPPTPVLGGAVTVSIGGRQCTNVTLTPYEDQLPAGVPPTSALANEYKTFTISCSTPPGVGSNLPILITTPGGTSQDDPNFRFSYSAPTITDVVDNGACGTSAAASFLTPVVAATGLSAYGIPTLGCSVKLVGSNFGSAAIALGSVCSPACPLPAAFLPSATLTSQTMSLFAGASVVAHDHESVVLAFPAGQGMAIQLVFSVGGQASTAAVVRADGSNSGTRPATLVRYREPSVTAIFNQGTSAQGGPTVGGTTISIFGANFGWVANSSASVAQGLPTITVGPWTAQLVSASNTLLTATLPEGWGKNVPVVVTVANQASVAAPYTYAQAVLASISPAGGPTSGRTQDGTPINMTIVGTNLGLNGSVELRPACFLNVGGCVDASGRPDATAVTVVVPDSAIFEHNHTALVFAMPEGAGANLNVVAVVGGQDSAPGPIVFSYDPPSIDHIGHSTRSDANCLPTVQLTPIFGSSPPAYYNKTFYPYPGCFPTVSDPDLQVLRISGQSFGGPRMPIRVLIGGKLCDFLSVVSFARTHNDIYCKLPNGIGDDVPVVVTVGGRNNVDTPAAHFAYDSPWVEVVKPDPVLLVAGDLDALTMKGFNFGGPEASTLPIVISIGGKPCDSATWVSNNLMTCVPQPDVVGPKNVTAIAANRTTPYVALEPDDLVQFRCSPGYYGLRGEMCLQCGLEPGMVSGAKCPGSELDTDRAVALFGWWRFNSTDVELCRPENSARVTSPDPHWGWDAFDAATGAKAVADAGCPVFVACVPPESCLGANKCDPKYTGARCQDCAARFYRVNGNCIKCPDSPWATVVVFLLIAVFCMTMAYWLNAKNINLALISIGMDWAQVVAMFARTRINWPALVKELFQILSAFNFNLELIAPECAIPSVTYSGKWLFIEGMPIFAWLFLLTIFTVRYLFKVCLGVEKRHRLSHGASLIATAVVVQRVLYLYLARNTLDVFNCSPADPPDYDKSGKMIQYMAWNISIVCNVPGGSHLFLLPFAAVALAIYVVGLPFGGLLFLYRNKEKVKYDQILRSALSGDDKATNPHYLMRNSFKAIYMNYRPGSWYWEFVVCCRKFLIAFCSLMFRATPSFQLAMALLVLFIAYVLQVRTQPYLSHAVAVETFSDHVKKAAEGNKLHVRIYDDMMARAAYYRARQLQQRTMSGAGSPKTAALAVRGIDGASTGSAELDAFYASKRSAFENQVLEGRHTILRNPVSNFIFDYNTAEAVLLASALLVNLAGICFDSSRFVGTQLRMPGRQAEYDSLATAILIIMFASIIYWFVALGFDILLVTAPESVQACLSTVGKAGIQAMQRAKAAGTGGAGKGKGDKTGSSQRRLRVIGGVEEALADPNAVVMNTNEFVVNQATRGGGGGGADGALDVSRMLSVDAPSAAQWARFQEQYKLLAEKAKSKAAEVERLLEERQGGGGGGGAGNGEASPNKVQVRGRSEFNPLMASGKKSARDLVKGGAKAKAGGVV